MTGEPWHKNSWVCPFFSIALTEIHYLDYQPIVSKVHKRVPCSLLAQKLGPPFRRRRLKDVTAMIH